MSPARSPFGIKLLEGSAGLHTDVDQALIDDNETPNCTNVEFDQHMIAKRRGARKVNSLAINRSGLNFDGTSGWVFIDDNANYDITANFTAELVWKPTTVAGAAGEQVLVGKMNTSGALGSQIAWSISQIQSGGVERFRFRYTHGGAIKSRTDTSTTVVAGTRYHVAVTFESGQQNIFVTNLDSGVTGTTSFNDAGALLDVAAPILFGAAGRTAAGFVDFTDTTIVDDEPISGVLDEVRVWAATLATGTTPATALSTYRDRELDTSHPNAASLRGYWKLNDASGVVVRDDASEINAGATTDNNGFLEPRRPQYVDGHVPDEQQYAIATDGYIQSVILPFAGFPTTDTNVRESYGTFVQQGNPLIWTIEFAVNLPTVASQQLFHWKTDAVSPDGFVLVVTTDASGFVVAEATAAAAGGGSLDLLSASTSASTVGLVANVGTMISIQRKLVRNTADTANRSQITIFLDGVSRGSDITADDATSRDRGPGGNLDNAFIGSNGITSASTYSNGQFDEVRLWTRTGVVAGDDTRTAAQILQYFDKPLPVKEINTAFSGIFSLIGYWKFDQNTRDYNDAPAATTPSGVRPNIFSEDSGRSVAVAGPPLRIVGGLSAALWPGTHAPEWTPGLLRGAVQGGLVDLITQYSTPSGEDELVIAGEGALLTFDGTTLPGALTAIKSSGFQGGRPASRVQVGERLYVTNGLSPPLVYDGTEVRRWGIQGPTRQAGFTSSGAGSGINGDVAYRYTYVSRESGVESDPSPESAVYRDSSATFQVTLLLQPSPDPQVDTIRIYRTLHGATSGVPRPGSAEFRFVDEITNTPTTTTALEYTDQVGDATLGFPLDSRDGFATAGPPPWCQYAVSFNGRIFMAHEPRDEKSRSLLFYSELDAPEEFGVLNVFPIESGRGEPITGLAVLFDRLFIFKRTSIFILSGFDETDFEIQQLTVGLGCISNFSIVPIDGWLYFLSNRGPYRTNGTVLDWIGKPIYSTFLDFAKDSIDVSNAGHNRNRHQVWFAVRRSGESSNDRVLVYDYHEERWTFFSNLWPQVLEGITDSEGLDRIFWGDDYGFVWRGDANATFNQANLGQTGTTFGTIAGVGTNGGLVTVTVTGAFGASASSDGWKGARIVLIDSDGTEGEGRIAANTSTVITIDKTAAELGFTPVTGDGYRIGSIDALYETKPLALSGPPVFATVEEIELEAQYILDNNAPVALTSVRIDVASAVDFSTTFTELSPAIDVTVSTAGTAVDSSVRYTMKSHSKRVAFRYECNFCHEGFAIRYASISWHEQGRT